MLLVARWNWESEARAPLKQRRTGRQDSWRGERAYDIYSRLLKDHIIFIGTPIGDDCTPTIAFGLWLPNDFLWHDLLPLANLDLRNLCWERCMSSRLKTQIESLVGHWIVSCLHTCSRSLQSRQWRVQGSPRWPPAAGIGLSASALVTDISPRFSNSIRLYRSKSLLFISDFLYSIEINGLERNILHPRKISIRK